MWGERKSEKIDKWWSLELRQVKVHIWYYTAFLLLHRHNLSLISPQLPNSSSYMHESSLYKFLLKYYKKLKCYWFSMRKNSVYDVSDGWMLYKTIFIKSMSKWAVTKIIIIDLTSRAKLRERLKSWKSACSLRIDYRVKKSLIIWHWWATNSFIAL